MRLYSAFAIAAAGIAPLASSLATYSPVSSLSYTLAVPPSGDGIYLQLSAPTTFQWVGVGIGSQMAGATIFVMYQNGNGNVTVSVRDGGQGHVEPLVDSTLMAGLEVLSGSGVVGDTMVANIKCTGCSLDSSSTSTSSPFICAWNPGSPIDSTSPSFTIVQHSLNNHRQFAFNPATASISSDSNPFVSATASGAASSSTSSSFNNGAVTIGGGSSKIEDYQKAHGIIMGITIVLLFPIGAMAMRIGFGGVWLHGAWQLLSLACLIVGFGLGVKLSKLTAVFFDTTHTVFGTVIFSLFLIQPLFGIAHHLLYRKYNSRTPVSHVHIWFGRVVMVMAVINGGLGLKLARPTGQGVGGTIAYSVVAGIIGLLYILTVTLKRKNQGVKRVAGNGDVDNGKARGWRQKKKVRIEQENSA